MAYRNTLLLEEKYSVKRVLLIGSLVRGIVHEKSDIDLKDENGEPIIDTDVPAFIETFKEFKKKYSLDF